MPEPNEDLGAVFTAARIDVERRRHQKEEVEGSNAGEVQLTNWLLESTWPSIRYADFNPNQEGVVGADWLWWFVDQSGICFGILMQAKKLTGRTGAWSLDLTYKDGTSSQMTKLLDSADHFEVPAAYILYCGDHRSRQGLACGSHDETDCARCERSSIAVLPALAARSAVMINQLSHQKQQMVEDAYWSAVPLEDMVRPSSGPLFDVNGRGVGPDLKSFLVHDQVGAAAVAKRFFEVISKIRSGQFSAATAELLPSVGGTRLFDRLPDDVGHWGVPYYEHVLRGLRSDLPAYVEAFLRDGEEPRELVDLAGLVVVQA